MKTLQQLREKYWSSATSLYPVATSPSKLEVRFDFIQFGVDKRELKLAHWHSFVAQCCMAICCDDDYMIENNRANYHLAGAYQIEGKNVEFWGQFV